MKLTEIAIDGYKSTTNTHLENLGGGLNVIVSSDPAVQRSITSFILDILYGPDRNAIPTTSWPNGHLNIQSGGQHYRLARPHSNQISELAISDLHGGHTSHRTPEMLNRLDHSTFGTFFNVSLDNANWNWDNFVSQLVSQFDLSGQSASGDMPFAADQESFETWKRTAEARIARFETIRQEIQAFNHEREQLLAEQNRFSSDHRSRLVSIESELSELQSRYDSIANAIHTERSRLSELDRQRDELARFIEIESSKVQHIPVARPATNFLALFYERLDEIDNQIRRWRSVQSDIQDQRLRLRDEMVTTGELNIESHDHPYHDAREIALALEAKIASTEEIAHTWEHNMSPLENERRLTLLCNEMHGDLQALCSELSRQYKHVRHKATVAELKQLRRCYHDMDENVKRLLVRRESIIDEIRQLDPEGAEAVIRGDQQFTMFAEQEGFLAARQRFVSGQPVAETHSATEYRSIYPDLGSERSRLTSLQTDRTTVAHRMHALETELQGFEPRRLMLVDERNRLSAQAGRDHEVRLHEIATGLATLERELQNLQTQIDTDRHWLAWKPNYLLTDASRYLSQISSQRLTRVASDSMGNITVRSETGHGVPATTLPLADQALVRLGLSMAAVDQLALRGIRLPFLIEDTSQGITNPELLPTIASFCRNGHQVVVLTANARLADEGQNYQGVVFELPDTNITSPNWQTETPSMPRHDFPTPPPTPSSHYRPEFESLESKYARGIETNLNPIPANPTVTRGWSSETRVVPAPIAVPARPISIAEKSSAFVPTPIVPTARAACSRNTMLQDIDLVESIYLTPIESLGIRNVGQLLDLDLVKQEADLGRRGFNLDQIDRWQAQAWLLVCLPELTAADARVLVGSGIDSPELLLQMEESDILERIKRYLDSSAGRRSTATYSQFNSNRLRSWSARLKNDNGWRTYTRTRSRNRKSGARSTSRPARTTTSSRQTSRQPSRQSALPNRGVTSSHSNGQGSRQSTKTTTRQPRASTSRDSRSTRTTRPTQRTSTGSLANANAKVNRNAKTTPAKSQYQFYLNMSDDIETAPSIGSRAAEQFSEIGIQTVSDFINGDATDMAAQLENRRMSAKTLKTWQEQSRLMCAVPNLRGHDVQILVACGILDSEQMTTMRPEEMLDIVLPFVKTKEGARILRNGKKPDLEEVTDWINAANNVRTLKAA